MEGYVMHHKNLEKQSGREIILYIRKEIGHEVINVQTEFEESTKVKIKMRGQDTLIVDSVYKSPSSSEENNTKLRHLINGVTQIKSSHLVIFRDFNYV